LKLLPGGPQDENLLVGFDTSDDAAVYRISDDTAVIQTVDFFPPMVDDPYTFGQVAAANALSDVYAMGGVPRLALNLLCFPADRLPPAAVAAILRGGADKVQEAGALLCGGHTVEDEEPKYGLCVTGFVHPDRVRTNAGAKAGDVLILTKAIGSGVLNTAAKADLLSSEQYEAVIAAMTTLNAAAARVMAEYPVSACTDVTGFGLIGHAGEMAAASGKTLRIMAAQVPLLPGALQFAQDCILPGGLYRNKEYLQPATSLAPDIPDAIAHLLFDPQTSGGLLISVPEPHSQAMLDALQTDCPDARIIGQVLERTHKDIEAVWQ